MKRILIREAVKADMPRVLELIRELAVFEREPDAVEVTAAQLEEDGFGSNIAFQSFVAEVEGKVGGMALVYPRYSTWKGVVLHLEDLIVTEAMRGMGLGEALLDRVVQYGSELGVKRISWEVLDWNTPAIDFYEKKGALLLRDWDVVHLDEEGIRNYLKNI
ncbi:GNAT family N-acetyltransferase [Lentiprolixibacter aurantiacus]|uniref:GNAT family N-acetyltransferase n=1 Tax=Lentiprolixibacter aurantiacus TaxID=2993939 RepID=A0AAE3MJM7_9FLAO|nr:GNAT family N-acetyltransferase [Lentiprolixibacter aurantiacus]MCX2718841.1 GNAT family N-acetyltransferase [Lentiprolixibacter aurantiacus]